MAAVTAAQRKEAWTNFNLDIWRPRRDRSRGQPGQGGVTGGLNTVWARLTAAQRRTVYEHIQDYTANETLLVALPIPAQIPAVTATINVVQGYFRDIYNRMERVETLEQRTATLIGILPQRPVRARLEAHRNTLDVAITGHQQTLGAIQDLERRCRDYARDIAPDVPPLGSPAADYNAVRQYFVNHINALRQRLVDRETLRTDFDNAINALNGQAGALEVAQRRCLEAMRSEQADPLTRLRSTVAVLNVWLQNDPRNGEPYNDIPKFVTSDLRKVDDIKDFVNHLDSCKAFHDALARMIQSYEAQLSAPQPQPDINRAELRSLFPVVRAAHGEHQKWDTDTEKHIEELQTTFYDRFRDAEGDVKDEGDFDLLDEPASMAVMMRESLNAELGQEWIGPMFVGDGGHGRVSLWIKQSMDGRIVDRVVVKDTHNYNENDTQSTGLWRPPTPQPLEVAAMYKLKDLPGSETIVRIRNWKTRAPWPGINTPRYRIYAEYCEGGSLRTLRLQHHDPAKDAPLPEPFLWAVFDSLVTAGLLMEGDHLPTETPPTWDTVVHGDMKADNVFLAHNTTDRFRGWQLCKLGDFGLVMIIPAAGIEPPDDWVKCGGGGLGAPEMAKRDSSVYPESPANVWGVGFTMRELIHTDAWQGLWDNAKNHEDPWNPPAFTPADVERYSASLRVLVTRCLQLKPENRPTFTEIRRTINAATGPTGSNPSLVDLRDAPIDDPRFTDHAPHRTVDKYAMGLAVDELPPDALPFERRVTRPTVVSADEDVVGGQPGEPIATSEDLDDAVTNFLNSVASNKRTFDKIN
ncbi:hypothetical protein AC578_3532 [Pseudocercospora eumusae]|uniref:Protein kinase domain-containing protein n=1 Tax=Pseudocercospora eumusae TaxID=321146 RepID=A0A139H9K3_9PEZI|nr:hypothetical protein AC578_3532 [Pseudocercospora eumusae]